MHNSIHSRVKCSRQYCCVYLCIRITHKCLGVPVEIFKLIENLIEKVDGRGAGTHLDILCPGATYFCHPSPPLRKKLYLKMYSIEFYSFVQCCSTGN